MKSVTRLCRITTALARSHGYRLIAGIDEVGIGAWAGPVVAGIVLVPPNYDLPGLDDSKRLSKPKREKLAAQIKETAMAVSVAFIPPQKIDETNILFADMLAMEKVVSQLTLVPDVILIDGRSAPLLSYPTITIVKGDSRSAPIAAASIIAKVWRDEFMDRLALEYPQYGWEENKGYGTAFHQAAIEQHGPCKEHRMSYRPIREFTDKKLF
jgi:ribonuclease HII